MAAHPAGLKLVKQLCKTEWLLKKNTLYSSLHLRLEKLKIWKRGRREWEGPVLFQLKKRRKKKKGLKHVPLNTPEMFVSTGSVIQATSGLSEVSSA